MLTPAQNTYRDLHIVAIIASIGLLVIHCYYYAHPDLITWHLTHPIADRLLDGIVKTHFFRAPWLSKVLILSALAITFIGGNSPTRVPSLTWIIVFLFFGWVGYFGTDAALERGVDLTGLCAYYIVSTVIGLVLLYATLRGCIARATWPQMAMFNAYNESFPQEERILRAPQSIHLKARYTYRNQVRNSVINFSQVYRGTIVMGSPGSGKTRYIFRQLIQQSLANSMAVFVFDLKYDDLTRLTYNTFLRYKNKYPVTPTFYSVNFDDFSRSHRCNPLDPASLNDIADASECARTIILAMNKHYIKMQGDFFVESAIAFFTANIWFLRQYGDGRYCTLAHLIELLQTDFSKLFSILRSEPTIETQISPFVSAYLNGSIDQLQGQVDSARIALGSLASPHLYYLLSANDFTLDLNNPLAPKIIAIGSNPQKQHIYGAVVSLYVTRMLKLVNRKGGIPCHLFFDEFASFFAYGIDLTLAQARSNRVAVTIGIQTVEQLRTMYGRDQADALFNLPANLICSQVSGDSARLVSERFGRILQDKNTVSVGNRDGSTSFSQQLDLAIPASKIATLSSGEFVGITADSPTQPMALKAFHSHVVIDNKAIEREEATWQSQPIIRDVDRDTESLTFRQVKTEVREMVETRLAYMAATPALAPLIVTKPTHPNQPRKPKP